MGEMRKGANDSVMLGSFLPSLVVLTKAKFTRSKGPTPSSNQPLYQWTCG
jgi:hypothetical protein